MCKVLIVEDDAINMFLYRKILENEGHDVLMSSTGSDAIEMAKRYNPDMVLLDIFLPGRSGFDIYNEMKEDKDLSSIPVVFASASFDNDAVIEKTGIARERVMRKPINFETLTSLVKQILQERILNHKNLSYA